MRSLADCPAKMPDYPTLDGKPMYPALVKDFSSEQLELSGKQDRRLSDICPTLVQIGLLDALQEVESVLAWNSSEKHSDAKWKRQTVDWHDAKAVNHLNQARLEGTPDNETGKSHRAHSACRLLMSLAHELNPNIYVDANRVSQR